MMNALVILRRYRLPEALVVAGFTFVGSLIAVTDRAALWSPRALLFFLASYLVIVSIYAFNSWAGHREDRDNPRLAAADLGPVRLYAMVSAGTFIAALAIFAFVRPVAIPYAAAIFLLWGVYSFPRHGAKYVPVAGTMVHIVVGMTQFQQGWTLFAEPDGRSVVLSCYFALILGAGHVNHELIDHDADRGAGIASGAVRFGVRSWTVLHFAMALCGGAVLVAIVAAGQWRFSQSYPFLGASLLHAASAFLLLRRTADQGRFLRHRAFYRSCYAAASVIYLLFLAGGGNA